MNQQRSPAKLDRRAIEAMAEAGALDRLGRVELIDGMLIGMSPSQSPHGQTLFALAAALSPLTGLGFQLGSDIGVFLRDDLMRAPDIVVARADAPVGFYTGEDILLAIEISAETLREDLGAKARDYAAAGIPEYWVVDLEGRQLHLHRAPGPEGYATTHAQSWAKPASPLSAPEQSFTLADILQSIRFEA